MKLYQRNLDQTGVAIIEIGLENVYEVPLYSLEPVQEAQDLAKKYFPLGAIIKSIYVTNNLMSTKIEDIIKIYRKTHLDLPEDLMEELVSGFPFVYGLEPEDKVSFYA